MDTPYILYYSRTDGKYIVACDKEKATSVIVAMKSGYYTCDKKFDIPEQRIEFDEYCRALIVAFNIGRKRQAAIVSDTLRGLLIV